ncbi:uncharacterized protein J4E87_006431 [Alternaria ethzedia]|uniref:uncharacterized protein n=1 Tax=Alternaria ethzedia TaxID=181014 RepID=UPI0020C1E2F1|nr:uncharacterized protein J4E87_006431 [Alternaria ethzedia]KAI4622489.1 hypothetical protein J4E87_006431 [Alternaria ethzedia]
MPTKNAEFAASRVGIAPTVAWTTRTTDPESSCHIEIPSWSNAQDLSSAPRPSKQITFIKERTQQRTTPRSKASKPSVHGPPAPKAPVVKPSVPKTQVPKTQVPKTQVPKTQVPKTQVPKTQVPNLKASNTKAPRPKAPSQGPPQPNTTIPKAQPPKTIPPQDWTVIPDSKQPSALTALILHRHARPVLTANEYKFGTTLPIPYKRTPKRAAICIDCEMVGVAPNDTSALARMSVIDYLTNEILIDTLVQPTEPVTDWRTKYSGITRQAMATAMSQGKALRGSAEARAELFKYVDSDTILVGHALQHDLLALGIRHDRIVDSAILAAEAVGKGVKRRWGLKDLASQLLDIKIQSSDKVGHDSVEDAFAAGEVVLQCIEQPNKLRMWGERKRKEYYGGKSKKTSVKKGVSSRGFRPSVSRPG